MNQNEQRQAVALRYAAKKDVAPRLVAKGRGYLAEKIIELVDRLDELDSMEPLVALLRGGKSQPLTSQAVPPAGARSIS